MGCPRVSSARLSVGTAPLSAVAGIDPASKAGELTLLLIRAYRSLFALVGGDAGQMRHWMHTRNLHTGGCPPSRSAA